MAQPQTKRSAALTMLERMYPGKSAAEIVREACGRHDTPEGAAAELGVSVTTLRKWRERFEIQQSVPAGAAR